MPTTTTQKDQIISHLELLGDFTVRPMMGEYLVYLNGVYFANICDGHLLIKITPATENYNLPKVLPYPSAKRTMFQVDNLDDMTFLEKLISETIANLPKPKPKKPNPKSPSL